MANTAEAQLSPKKKRFAWEWLAVAVVLIGLVAMEGIPTVAFILTQQAKKDATERIYTCRLHKGLKTADRSLIRWEMDQAGPKAWRDTAAKLEKGCEG